MATDDRVKSLTSVIEYHEQASDALDQNAEGEAERYTPSVLNLELYHCVESVSAAEMTLDAYLEMRGWDPHPDDPIDKQGYFVEMPDFGPGFLEGYSGYTFWAGKKEFVERFQKVPKTFH